MTAQQLGVVLLALLPKDGTPRSVAWLCELAMVSRDQVLEAMAEPAMQAVRFDAQADVLQLQREDA